MFDSLKKLLITNFVKIWILKILPSNRYGPVPITVLITVLIVG